MLGALDAGACGRAELSAHGSLFSASFCFGHLAFRRNATWPSPRLVRVALRSLLPGQRARDQEHRIVVPIDDALLQRDDAVVGDVDVLGAHLGAAPRDVAVARSRSCADLGDAVRVVERVHLEAGEPDHEPRADELVLAVAVAQDVADVLAQEALDALAELLHAVDVLLVHPVLAVGVRRVRLERPDAPVLPVVPATRR